MRDQLDAAQSEAQRIGEEHSVLRAKLAALEERHRLVYQFFQTNDQAEAVEIARSLGARFLALYGRDRVRFDATGVLIPVYEEPEARVFEVRPPAP